MQGIYPLKKNYRILLIEPDHILAKTIGDWLKHIATVIHFSEKEEAIDHAIIGDWDLIITDVNSSEMDDLEITQKVKKTNPSTSVLIIAENVKVEFILTAMQYHADGLLFKPLNQEEFVTRVIQLTEESRVKKIDEKKVILAIGAHPDDVEFGCGGTLAKLRAAGNEVNILTLSLGAAGGPPEIRKQEAENAAKLQGARLFLGDFFDTNILSSIETIRFIESILIQVQPTHVYTHSFHDSHQDHRNIYQASVTACRSIPNLFSYLSPSGTVDFRPSIFINIDNYMDQKLKALAAYTSQSESRPYLQPAMIKATARYWGRFGTYNLVEPMEVIKQS